MKDQHARGLFITVEGGEGVGKTTNIACLRDSLQQRGVELIVTREPGGTELGEQVRELLLSHRSEPMDPLAELLLVFAARAQHLARVIKPALARGCWVICDRFTDATYAYQAGGRELDAEQVARLEQLVQDELRPDVTLLLDAPVEIGIERARGRGELDRFESETVAFFERVRATYLQIARDSGGRVRVVDAAQPLDEVTQQVEQIAAELLGCWGVRHP